MFIQQETVSLDELPDTIGPAPDPVMVNDAAMIAALNPPTLANDPDLGWLIIDGNRRISAMRAAGLRDITCNVIHEIELDQIAALTIKMNALRDDNLATETDAVRVLLQAGLDKSAIGKTVGRDTRYVDVRLRYASANANLYRAFHDGHIAPSTMEKIVKLTPEQQDRLSMRYSMSKKVGPKDIQEVVKETTPEPEPAPIIQAEDPRDPDAVPLPEPIVSKKLNHLAQCAKLGGMIFTHWHTLANNVSAYDELG